MTSSLLGISDESPQFSLGDITPQTLQNFLRMQGWSQVEHRENISSIWENEAADASLLIPLSARLRDYQARMNDAVQAISDVYHLEGESLGLEIASASSDILLLRPTQFLSDGTIPIREAQSLLDGVHKMVLAAACSAIRPRPAFPGRKPRIATDFVNQDVRMGHTLRGSFVISILARLDNGETPSVAQSETAERPAKMTRRQAADDLTVPRTFASYTRQVMSTLASGLEATKAVLSEQQDFSLDAAVEQGASAEMFDSIQQMTSEEGVSSLDLRFRWSPAEPIQTRESVTQIAITREEAERSKPFVERLRSKPNVRDDRMVGQVVRLERGPEDAIGIVIVEGVVGKLSRRVHVSLTGDEYDVAVRAHETRDPVILNGDITIEKRSLWMRSPRMTVVTGESNPS